MRDNRRRRQVERKDGQVKHPGAVAGWFLVIAIFVLMLVWATTEGGAATAFMATCLGLLIVVPLLTRTPKP